jgi:hypothetical protein
LQRPDSASRRRFIAADAAVVAIFVLIGRNEHNSGSQIAGFLTTIVPFLMAIAAAWSIPVVRRSPITPTSGLFVWVSVIVLGMTFRRLIFDGGTATPFVVVATIFNGVFLLGWRVFACSRARQPDRGVPLG